MPVVQQTRTVPFLPEQMFDLVVDVDQYPQFLPWCVASRIRERTEQHIIADLVIGSKWCGSALRLAYLWIVMP